MSSSSTTSFPWTATLSTAERPGGSFAHATDDAPKSAAASATSGVAGRRLVGGDDVRMGLSEARRDARAVPPTCEWRTARAPDDHARVRTTWGKIALARGLEMRAARDG